MSKTKFKFPLHDTHMHKMLHNVKVSCFLALSASFTYYWLHNVPKKLKYKNFYTTYDPMDAFDRMRRGGYLQSCPAEPESDKKKK